MTKLKVLFVRRPAISPQKGCNSLQPNHKMSHAMHAQRLLHGDVKPSNILLDVDSGSARLADFGLARAAKRQESAAPGASVASVSGVKGSAAFLDPI